MLLAFITRLVDCTTCVPLTLEEKRMARKAQDVTDAELAILESIWSRGPQSVKSLAH